MAGGHPAAAADNSDQRVQDNGPVWSFAPLKTLRANICVEVYFLPRSAGALVPIYQSDPSRVVSVREYRPGQKAGYSGETPACCIPESFDVAGRLRVCRSKAVCR